MNALVTKAKEADEDQDDFWGGLGADYFGIKRKSGPGGFKKAGDTNSDVDAEDEDDLLEGMLADDDQDFNSAEASADDANDSFDSDFGRDEEESAAEQGDEDDAQPKKKQKTGKDAEAGIDEDRMLELQEKREATKKKVKFHQSLLQKSQKNKQ